MGRFDVGSRWRCNFAPSPWYHVGGVYVIQDAPAIDGYMAISDDRELVGVSGMLTTEVHINKYFTRIPDEPASPIREITKREIVPGIYGLVEIPSEPDGFLRIRLQREAFNADELDAAASVLTQVAAVMRENSNG